VAQLGLVLLFVFALAGGIALLVRRDTGRGVEITLPQQAAQVTVQVSGAVTQPGVYTLPQGARLGDAVRAAGGLAPDGDADRMNLAAPLRDGERYQVPRAGETASAGVTSAQAQSELVNLNTATQQQLEALPGIGEVRAQAILDYRRRFGLFRSVDDLLNVSGIGPATVDRLRPLVAVE
jgi:competence protein ComEA